VIEHLAHPVPTLTALCQVLEHGGVLRAAVPNVAGVSSFVFRRHWRALEPRHLALYAPDQLTRLLQESGFRDVRVAGETAAKDIVVSAQILFRGHVEYRPLGPFSTFVGEALHPLARIATALGAPDRLQAIATR